MTRIPLDRLLNEIRACRVCRDTPKGKPLPHEPRPVLRVHRSARICIVGQAPGTRVHASGTPFTDPSGDRLRAWMDVDADTFYDASRICIVPMGFCFPGLDEKGGDLPPRRECAPLWRDRVFAELPNVRLILLVGQYAQAWHLGPSRKKTLTDTVRGWREYVRTPHEGVSLFPLPHPSWRNNAWLKKNPWFQTQLLPELRGKVLLLLHS